MFSWFLLVLCWYFFLVLVFQQEISHFNKLKFSISSFHGVIPALQVSLTKIPLLYLTKNTVFAMHLSPQISPHCRFDFILAFLYFSLHIPLSVQNLSAVLLATALMFPYTFDGGLPVKRPPTTQGKFLYVNRCCLHANRGGGVVLKIIGGKGHQTMVKHFVNNIPLKETLISNRFGWLGSN